MRLELQHIPRAILACVILHNIAIDLKMPVPEEDGRPEEQFDVDEDPQIVDEPRQLLSERRARDEGNRIRAIGTCI